MVRYVHDYFSKNPRYKDFHIYISLEFLTKKRSRHMDTVSTRSAATVITITKPRTDGRHLFVSKQILAQVYIASSIWSPLFGLQINEGLSGYIGVSYSNYVDCRRFNILMGVKLLVLSLL